MSVFISFLILVSKHKDFVLFVWKMNNECTILIQIVGDLMLFGYFCVTENIHDCVQSKPWFTPSRDGSVLCSSQNSCIDNQAEKFVFGMVDVVNHFWIADDPTVSVGNAG